MLDELLLPDWAPVSLFGVFWFALLSSCLHPMISGQGPGCPPHPMTTMPVTDRVKRASVDVGVGDAPC